MAAAAAPDSATATACINHNIASPPQLQRMVERRQLRHPGTQNSGGGGGDGAATVSGTWEEQRAQESNHIDLARKTTN